MPKPRSARSVSLRWEYPGTLCIASAVATLVTRAVAPLRFVFGLVERILYVAFLAWLVVVASSLAS